MPLIEWSTASRSELEKWNSDRHFHSDLYAAECASSPLTWETRAVIEGSVFIARSKGNGAFQLRRNAGHIRRSSTKLCTFYFPLHHRFEFAQDGCDAAAEPDHFFVLHDESPLVVSASSDDANLWEALFVTVPHELLAESGCLYRDVGAISFDCGSGFGRTARDLFDQIVGRGQQITGTSVRRLSTAGIQILCEAMRESGLSRERRSIQEAQFERLRSSIEGRLSEPGLSAAAIAQQCGISLRYLHLLFSGHGTSFARFLWAARLKRAAALIDQPEMHRLSLESIAEAAGFSSSSHLSRMYQAVYGCRPSAARKLIRDQSGTAGAEGMIS